MNRLRQVVASCRPYAQQALWLASAAVIWVASSPLALAKKKAEVQAVETKSYVMPYFIVLMLIGLGLMAILRPGKRADRPEEKKNADGE